MELDKGMKGFTKGEGCDDSSESDDVERGAGAGHWAQGTGHKHVRGSAGGDSGQLFVIEQP